MLPTAFRHSVADRKGCLKVIAKGSPKLLQFLGIVLIGVASLLSSSCSFMGFSPFAASQKQVSVTPPAPTVASGGRIQFAATVQNTWNPAVVWSADNGVISRSGLFTAPTVRSSKSVTVTASSVANPNARTSVTVYVTPFMAPNQLAITSLSLPQLQAGIPYVAKLTAQGGKTPYHWSVSSGSLPAGLSLNGSTGLISGITAQSGPATFTAKVADSALHTAMQSFALDASTPANGNYDGPAELPRVYMQSATSNTPAPGKTTLVSAGGDLQAALNTASCGDTIQLQAGATFSGRFALPAKPCDDSHWIIVRTSAPDSALPPEGDRITPCYAGVKSLAGRPTYNCVGPANALAKILLPSAGYSISAGPKANHYRLFGLEITRTADSGIMYALLTLGTADHIIIDRSWVHGSPFDETKRGVDLESSTQVAIIDSYFNDFHCIAITGSCTDAQAILGGNSNVQTGPYKIVNNFLEGAAETILFGGADGTTVPADIEIRRNHMFKPLTWMRGTPNFIGIDFIVKNLTEFKNAQRVLFEGNLLENSWGGFSQAGWCMVFTPRGTWAAVQDITIRYNQCSHVGAGFQLDATKNTTSTGVIADSLAAQRWSIHDVIVDDMNAATYKGNGVGFQISSEFTVNVPLNHVTIDHVTMLTDPQRFLLQVGENSSNSKLPFDIQFTNNIAVAGQYSVWNTGELGSTCPQSGQPLATFSQCWSPNLVLDNVIVGYPSSQGPWPPGNFFPPTATAVGFTNFNGGSGGNYRLLSSSPYKNKASNGKDLGADVNAINMAIVGVQ